MVKMQSFFFLYIILFIYFWLCWGFASVRGPPPAAASGDHHPSRCAGPSPPRPLLLRSTGSRRAGSVAVGHGPSRSAARGILPDQGSNLRPLHRQADSHLGSPNAVFFEAQSDTFTSMQRYYVGQLPQKISASNSINLSCCPRQHPRPRKELLSKETRSNYRSLEGLARVFTRNQPWGITKHTTQKKFLRNSLQIWFLFPKFMQTLHLPYRPSGLLPLGWHLPTQLCPAVLVIQL